MLELREPSTMNLQSNLDTWELVENIIPGPDFISRCFEYCSPHLYYTSSKTNRQIENIEVFKKSLNTYINRDTFDLET